MNIWQPEPGEALLARTPVAFATGEVMRVRGMRWFRDTERNDIQSELPGWPEGPVYTARSTGDALVRNTVKGAAITLGVAVMAALTGGGGSGPSSSKSGSGSSDDRANEIDDFPVMWAAPGSIARTLPWQLDPGRSSEERYRTHAIVTDRRLVIVGLPFHKKDRIVIEDEVLWETARSTISRVEPRNFRHDRDVKVVFTDDSWCRLRTFSRTEFTRHLVHPLDLVPLGSLTPAQRNTVDSFLATARAEAPDAGPPVITRRPCGHYRVEVLPPSKFDSFSGASELEIIMDSDGAEVELTAQHPDDF
ncbi:hypothetical protein ACIPC1_34880 [Streptomyces sp. NPDC087263]|uniref:hypothetical protein n=1 Tax=Streptomyces sp. NPDC087263 TaxID=3365773 RepID=UPI0038137AD1